MTVAVGLVCSNGVVVASDGMSTSGGVARKGQKVNALAHLPLVWTASGSVYVIEDVTASLIALDHEASTRASVRNPFSTPDLGSLRTKLAEVVREPMKQCYVSAMPGQAMGQTAQGMHMHPFATDFLLLGWANGKPYFLEIAHDGQLNWHHDEGFYAVGSGGEFASVAQALMAHYLEGEDLTVDLGLQFAYRTIHNTIEVSSQYVGPPIQLAVADDDGARLLDEGDVERVKQAVQGWMKIEAETLRRQTDGQEQPALEELPSLDAPPP